MKTGRIKKKQKQTYKTRYEKKVFFCFVTQKEEYVSNIK